MNGYIQIIFLLNFPIIPLKNIYGVAIEVDPTSKNNLKVKVIRLISHFNPTSY